MSSVKQAIMKLVNALPEDCTWDDAMYQMYVRQKLEAGLKDIEEGRIVTDEEMEKEFGP